VAIRFPTITSLAPDRKRRPSVMRMPLRTSNARSSTPRATTFPVPNPPMRVRFSTTYTSGLKSGRPSGPCATWGLEETVRATSRDRPLDSSSVAPFRSTITLSSDPVVASAA
jgi:hypothetical protein